MAVCPVCTIAVAGGVGLCRFLGIDDLISGAWIGALLFSLFLWTIEWLDKRKIKFLFRKPLVFIFWYGLTIFPLMKIGIIGHPQNKFWGIDKLIFGIFSGTVVFLLSILFENYLRKKNQGRAYFKFQKVLIPVLFLIILSLIFWRVC
jgi:hypothetical protein